MTTATQPTTDKEATVTEPNFLVLDVDPEQAQEWLLHNDRNRGHREGLVRQYADDMLNGRWVFNGEPIQLSVTGRLLNGQHRLKAILRSQTTQKFLVGFDFPDQTQLTMDLGSRRTAGDQLALEGLHHTKTAASIAKLVINERIDGRYIRFFDGRPTTLHILDVVTADERIIEASRRTKADLAAHLASPSAMGYCWWKLSKLDEDAADAFFSRLSSLTDLGAGHPILALNKRLTHQRSMRSVGGNTVTRQQESITYVFSAWNAWRRHEDRDHLKVVRDAQGRICTPVPH